jgi:CheY-like chemotaxis protein
VSAQRILCADTNPYCRGFATPFLTDSGYEVAATGTASDMISLIRERPDHYDLLIVADWLPDMDRSEFFTTLRSIPFRDRIVVNVPELSPEEKTKYHSLGASSFLLTPVGYFDILWVVNPPASDAWKTSAA